LNKCKKVKGQRAQIKNKIKKYFSRVPVSHTTEIKYFPVLKNKKNE
jgi:hypothetical protein